MQIEALSSRERNICYLLFLLPIVPMPFHFAIISLAFVLVFLMYFSDGRFRKIASSYPLLIWLCLTLYHWFNAIHKGIPGVDTIDLLHGFKIYACICIFAYWASIDVRETVYILTKVFIARSLIVLLMMFLFNDYTVESRLTGMGSSATGNGHIAAITGFFILYLNVMEDISLVRNIRLYLVPLIMVVLTQSRISLVMLLCTMLVVYFVRNKGQQVFLFRIIIGGFLAFVITFTAIKSLEGTNLGQRFQDNSAEESYFYEHYSTGTIFDKVVGDRLVYYVRGWEFFQDSPVTGIGMWGYKYLTGGQYPLHSEYMVHLCEGGVIGVSLWILFLLSVIYCIMKNAPNIQFKMTALSILVITLFCGIYAREFFYEEFYPAYGIALSFSHIMQE